MTASSIGKTEIDFVASISLQFAQKKSFNVPIDVTTENGVSVAAENLVRLEWRLSEHDTDRAVLLPWRQEHLPPSTGFIPTSVWRQIQM